MTCLGFFFCRSDYRSINVGGAASSGDESDGQMSNKLNVRGMYAAICDMKAELF